MKRTPGILAVSVVVLVSACAPSTGATSVYSSPIKGYVALTFDDGPTASTPQLLSILNKYHATATFFDVGANMQKHPSDVKQEAAIGQVGNLSYSHPFLNQMTYSQIFNELLGTNRIAQQYTGKVPVLFRPPFDRIDQDVTTAQYSLGLLTALWNIDSGDYNGISVKQIEANVWNAKPGDVILFHDGLANTLAALPAILAHFQAGGLMAGELIPSRTPHFAWSTRSYGSVIFYSQVVAPGTRAPSVGSLGLTSQQQSTAVGPTPGPES